MTAYSGRCSTKNHHKIQKMKHIVAVGSQNKKTISGHGGRLRKFYFYTIENNRITKKEYVETPREEVLHEVFHNMGPDAHHPIFDADIFLAAQIGQGAIARLAQKNVRAYITPQTDPDTAIKELIEGTLQVVDMSKQNHGGCGHDHSHDHGGCGHDHSHDHEHNHSH
ncbi:MAG TPA: hypothetical protein ENK85_05785 [Saprospiraceae bacterium]|nr:hypothetical protein [Saprospiraceae bacterium]